MNVQRAMDGVLGPALFLLLAFLLRASVMPYLAIDGVTPNLILAVVVMTALRQGAARGGAFGLVAGFVVDIATGRFIGLHALGLWLGGYAAGLLRQRLYPDTWFVPMLGVVVAMAVQDVVLAATLFVAHLDITRLPLLLAVEVLYTVPFAYMLRPPFHRPEAPA